MAANIIQFRRALAAKQAQHILQQFAHVFRARTDLTSKPEPKR